MKPLTICLLLTICLHSKMLAAEPPAAFKKAFAEHHKKDTLFDYRTARGFIEKGWGRFYQETVASDFKGAPVDKVRLVIGPVKGSVLQIGDKLALIFRLFNDSDCDATAYVAGTCKTVHAASYMVIDWQGNLLGNVGRGKVGGPHCFCQQSEAILWHRSARWLDTATDSDSVVGWAPDKAGKYVIIGVYACGTKEEPERRILSKPIVLNVNANK